MVIQVSLAVIPGPAASVGTVDDAIAACHLREGVHIENRAGFFGKSRLDDAKLKSNIGDIITGGKAQGFAATI